MDSDFRNNLGRRFGLENDTLYEEDGLEITQYINETSHDTDNCDYFNAMRTQKVKSLLYSYDIKLELPYEKRKYYLFEINHLNGRTEFSKVYNRPEAYKQNMLLMNKQFMQKILGFSLAQKSNDYKSLCDYRLELIEEHRELNKHAKLLDFKENFFTNLKKCIKYLFIGLIIFYIFF